jgi:DNA-binding transcriptional ArsR family regulator
MNLAYPIASVAELIGEPSRAAMLVALLDGRALPSGELARVAGISPQSASGHLARMVDAGLLAVRNGGRHRYYTIANPNVGHAVEALSVVATPGRRPAPASGVTALHVARSCYDHLAGRVGTELTAFLETARVIRPSGVREYDVDREGAEWFAAFGIDLDTVRRSRRSFALQCNDWTERRSHLAGALGAALLSRLLALGWMAHRPNTRVLRITHRGEQNLRAQFGVAIPHISKERI